MIRNFLRGALFSLIALTFSTQAFAQSEVIEKRRNLMKNNSAAAKAINGAVSAKDYATVELKAKDILGNAEKIPALFPKGSTKGKTRAKAEIWENHDDFLNHAKTLNKSASELAAAAKAGNDAELNVKLKALGNTCDSCHKQFRAAKFPE
jgi:cytochrome c556